MGHAIAAKLGNRGGIRVGGADAHEFLQGLVTCDMEQVDREGCGYGALLTPQGKILFDFLISTAGDGYLIDVVAVDVAALLKRLTLYRLRAAVELADVTDDLTVTAIWGEGIEAKPADGLFHDPRHPGLGFRQYAYSAEAPPPAGAQMADNSAWVQRRIEFGIPEAGVDFQSGDAFPHDINLDQIGGVDFDKGCYVGQEVVSRMRHRGTARRRLVKVEAESELPEGGEITADGRVIGALGSRHGNQGLASVRIDRAAQAKAAGGAISVEGVALELALPPGVDFIWPGEAGA